MKLLENYNAAKQAIYDHVGLVEDYVTYPIADQTEYFWSCDGENVHYAKTLEDLESDGDFYSSEVYTQRFYKKWIYEGEKFTLIFEDTHTDGMKYFGIYDNSKRIQ